MRTVLLVLTLAALPVFVLSMALAMPRTALAGEPYCAIEETCTITSDNCVPAEGRVVLRVQPGAQVTKATIILNGENMGSGSVLGLHNVTAIMFTSDDGVENQLRIQESGRFNYLVSRPDPEAHKGKDQILYRGQCVEG